MERLLNGAGWREEQRYQTPSSSQRIARTPALSRAGISGASAPIPAHSSLHFSPEMPLKMTNEKELLRGLNDRFAGFIEKVHHLERQNRALEREIEDIRLKAKSSSSLAKQYEPQLQDLRRQISEMSVQKHEIELEQKRVEDELKALREKCAEEARSRAEAEESITALKRYMDSAYIAKQDMDRKATALTDEIDFLKRNHEAEVADILTQMNETRVCREVSGFGKGELTAALRAIRTHLEDTHTLCPHTPSEEHFNKQLAKLTKAAETDREALIATKAEISQNRRQLQSKNIELDSVRGMREALERQLYDLEQRHTAEIHHYQDTIRELEQELKNTKYDMSGHVQEYHDLLNVKMALDAEIYSYRKLLEGEESRYSTLSDTQIPVPYVYRQSPIYTLPSVPRVGGVTRKAEPQYKFVEEIITETTREDVEILDTASDDAEEQRQGDNVCIEKENAGVAAGSEVHSEEQKTQESVTEDNTGSLDAEQLDNEEKLPENEEQSLTVTTDVSVDLKESDMSVELAQNNITVSELTGEKDTENSYDQRDDTDSKTQEPDSDTQPEKPEAEISGDEHAAKVTLETELKKPDIAKEIDQASIKQSIPTEQTAVEEAITEKGKRAVEEISPKSEGKKEVHHVTEPVNEEQSLTMASDVSVDLKESDMSVELAQNNITASELTGEKDTENNYNKVDDTDSKTQEPDSDTQPEKPEAEISGDEHAAKVTLETEIKKLLQEAITEKGKSAVEEISPKSEGKKEVHHVTEPEASSTGKTMEKDKDISEVKSVEVDTSSADQQPESQKAEAGQETRPHSKADSEQSVEKLQAEILDTTKTESAEDNAEEVQKVLTEKVKTEAPLKHDGKEIQSEEEKKVDIKPEGDRETVKTEKRDGSQSRKTQEDVSKTTTKEPEVETSENKEILTKDIMDSVKTEGSTELKKTEKEVDQVQIKEQPKVAGMETKSEGKSQKTADGAKEDQTKSPEAQKEDIQKEPKSTDKEITYEPKPEKHDSKETSEDIKKIDIIKPKEQKIDSKTCEDIQPQESVLKASSEKEQSEDQKTTDKDAHERKDTKTEKADKSDSSEAKQDNSTMDKTKSKDLEKDPAPLQESKKLDPTEKGHVSAEKVQDNSMNADLKKERDIPVTENGVNI